MPDRAKPATTWRGVNAVSNSLFNKVGWSIFRIVFLWVRSKYDETILFQDIFARVNREREKNIENVKKKKLIQKWQGLMAVDHEYSVVEDIK